MKRIVNILLSTLCFAYAGVAQATEMFSDDVMAISYDDGSGVDSSDGTGKAEHYDVALYLDDAGLAGKSIVGFKIPFASIEDISGLKVWAATKLELSETEKLPVCDIAEISAEVQEGWTEVVLDNPIELDANGIYIGYSFDVNRINSNNLKPVCLTSVVSENGYFIHTSRTAKYKQGWTNVNEKASTGSLRMQAMVKGMDANAASIEIYPKINVQLGAVAYIPVRITCHGYNGVSSIDYEYDMNGTKGEQSFVLESPIAAIYNKYADIDIPLQAVTDTGQLPISINLTKVNGSDNTDAAKTADGTLNVFDFVPVHRPLFEEYTGAWCGNCPRGLAAIEAMKELHPDDFVCISYHNSDAMEITNSFPSEIKGFPDSWISRKKHTDPFFGDKSGDGRFHLDEEWSAIKKEPTTISVDIDADWTDQAETAIGVEVKIMSQINYSANQLAIGCALIADDLYGTTSGWLQQNYYSGTAETCAPELQWIAELPKIISNFHFNDVLILGENLDGLEANLPFEIEPMNEYVASFSLPLDNAVSTEGINLVQNKSKLRVIAFVIDRNSTEIINSNQTDYMVSSGVEATYSDSDVTGIEYYDMLGRKIEVGSNGLVLRVIHLKDGSKICNKLIIK